MIEETISHMCKSSRAMGLSRSKWLNVEDHLSVMLRESGPEFTIQYLKDLKEWSLGRMVGEPVDLKWHRKTSQGHPAGWQKSLVGFAKPKTSIQILGALINSIELGEMSSKQYEKWHTGVRVDRDRSLIAKQTANIFDNGKWVKKKHQTDMSRDFLRNFADNTLFGLKDLTGKSIPVGVDSENLSKGYRKIHKIEKKLRNQKVTEDQAREKLNELLQAQSQSFINAWIRTVQTSPVWAANMEVELIDICDERGIPVRDKMSRLLLAEHIRKYNDDVPAGDVEWGMDDFGYGFAAETSIYPGSNGHVAFLQQPGGKLRTICNPNRYAQHVLRPLQKAMFNHTYLKMSTNSVFDQKSGIKWAQHQLQQGRELASMDLSSATDLLNSQEFINNALVSHLSEDDPLTIALDYFEIAAKGNWEVPALNRQISFTEGQPLGLGPSFPLLTLQNTMAAMLAVEQGMHAGVIPYTTDYSDCFRVVGDDMIIISELKDLYANNIAAMGGQANPEKAMLSSKYAEFCSQLITSQGSWPLKPKIRGTFEYVLVDAENATSLAGLMSEWKHKGEKVSFYSSVAEALSEYSGDDSLVNLPTITSSNHKSALWRYAVSIALDTISQEKLSSPSGRSVGSKAQIASYLAAPSLGNGWALERFRFFENLGRIDTSSDEIPSQIMEFNHKTGEYEAEVVDPLAYYRNLYKTIQGLDIVETNKSVVVRSKVPRSNGLSVEVLADKHETVVDLIYKDPIGSRKEQAVDKVVFSRDLPGLQGHREENDPRTRVLPTVKQAEAELSAQPRKVLQSKQFQNQGVKGDNAMQQNAPSSHQALEPKGREISRKAIPVATSKDEDSVTNSPKVEIDSKKRISDEDSLRKLEALMSSTLTMTGSQVFQSDGLDGP